MKALLRRGALLAVLFAPVAGIFAPAGAQAEEPVGCNSFKWPVAEDQEALAASGLAAVETGGLLPPARAVNVRLAPTAQVAFALAPERAPKPETFAAIFTLQPSAAGVYRITLSEAGWVDVIQDGAAIKPLAFSGARDCPHVRKSLKFQLSAKSATIQLSNIAAKEVGLVVRAEAAPAH